MRDFKIGDLVTVSALATVNFIGSSNDKGLIELPLEEPFVAAIIGKATKQTGTYHRGSRAGYYGEEAEPPYLSIDKVITFWQIRHGMLNKPLLTLDKFVTPYEGDYAFPARASSPRYAETDPVDPLIRHRSDEQLAVLRKQSADYLVNKIGYDPETLKFTCDDCAVKNECALAFDAYNTNGDCLALK